MRVSTPVVGIVFNGETMDAIGFRHLLGTLRLPQVTVLQIGQQFPTSVKALIVDEGVDARTLPISDDVAVWYLGSSASAPNPSLDLVGGARYFCAHKEVRLPRSSSIDAMNLLLHTVFWYRERIKKRSAELPDLETQEMRLALYICYEILGIVGLDGEELTREEFAQPEPKRKLRNPATVGLRNYLSDPVSLVWRAIHEQKTGLAGRCRRIIARRLTVTVIEHLFERATTSRQQICIYLSARIMKLDLLAKETAAKICQSWFSPGLAFPRKDPNKTDSRALTLTPLAIAFWAMMSTDVDGAPIHTLQTGIRPSFHGLEIDPSVADPPIHSDRRSIDKGMLRDWCTLHGIDLGADCQIYLDSESYTSSVTRLESKWLGVFRAVFSHLGIPLVRILPFPPQFKSALSVRFDVDRPIRPSQLDDLVQLQLSTVGHAFGSWYLHPHEDGTRALSSLLRAHGQEVGLHLERASDALPGLGTTHHSAPTSEYWRGRRTLSVLASRDASYGEHLRVSLPTARQTLDANPQLGRFWVTPLHFPLEGSTSDRTLDYFDQLKNEFQDRLDQGGHAILGSHPDIGLPLLERFLSERADANSWYANVGEVVARFKLLSAITSETVSNERGTFIDLYGPDSLLDVAVDLLQGEKGTTLTVRLNPKEPVSIRLV